MKASRSSPPPSRSCSTASTRNGRSSSKSHDGDVHPELRGHPQLEELANPLLEGLHRADPGACALVIFGASGDLTWRKLFPALYSLAYRRLLPEQFGVVGVARTEMSDDDFRARMGDAVKGFGRDEFREDVWKPFAEGIRYVAGDASQEGEYHVTTALDELERSPGRAATGSTTSRSRPTRSPRSCEEIGQRRRRTAGRG